MSDDLRTRIVAALKHADAAVTPFEDIDSAWSYLADAVIEALGPIPNRSHVDDRNNRWEWCGWEPGTWAWRITRLGPEPLHPMYPRNYPEGRDYEPF